MVCVVEGILQQRENARLRRWLASQALPDDATAKAFAIADYVRNEIRDEGLDINMPRPFLRATALETLESRRGFCGEQARVLIRLLQLSGFDAHRVYLWNGAGDEHVVAEALVGGRNLAFETLSSLPNERDLSRLMAANRFTNRSYWSPRVVRALGRDPFEPGSFWVRTPPPLAAAAILESPHAIGETLGGAEFILVSVGGGAWRLRRRRSAGRAPNADIPDGYVPQS
jgi:hypothetical protein